MFLYLSQGPLYLMQGLKIQTNGDRLNGVKTPCEKKKQQEKEQERPRKIEINQGAVDDSTINTIVSTLKVCHFCNHFIVIAQEWKTV